MDAHSARFYETLPDRGVKCTLCPHDCVIAAGMRGACGVRYNDDGQLRTLVYDKVVARAVDPIEKKPLFHFYPGSHAYSIATVGCNLRCAYCQNWTLSQWPKEHLPKRLGPAAGEAAPEPVCPQLATLEERIPGEKATPAQLVEAAVATGCRSMSYTYVEPTVFYELAYDTAVLARKRGLKNTFVTNGFISEGPVRELASVLDAANIDLKFFSEASYRRVSRARLQPVLDTIRLFRQLGVWIELTTLVVPGLNDTTEELTLIAKFVRSLGPEIPWHLTAFYPAYRMLQTPPTEASVLRRARQIGLSTGLRYVYDGNIPGTSGENTWCHRCGTALIERYGFFVRTNVIRDGRCPRCATPVDGAGMSGAGPRTETTMERRR